MENSIKLQTRQKRYGKGHGPIVHSIADAVIPKNCKGFLAVNKNKSAWFYKGYLALSAPD